MISSCATQNGNYGIHCKISNIDPINNTITLTQEFSDNHINPNKKSITYDLDHKIKFSGISNNQKVVVYFTRESAYKHKIINIIPE